MTAKKPAAPAAAPEAPVPAPVAAPAHPLPASGGSYTVEDGVIVPADPAL